MAQALVLLNDDLHLGRRFEELPELTIGQFEVLCWAADAKHGSDGTGSDGPGAGSLPPGLTEVHPGEGQRGLQAAPDVLDQVRDIFAQTRANHAARVARGEAPG